MSNSDSPNDVLWHYTSGEAFLKIVRAKSIHATDVACLNDATEFQYSVSLLVDHVLKDDPERLAMWKWRRMFGGPFTHGPHQSVVCVFCASEHGDSLSQWRAYAPAGGVAIGFDRSGLTKMLKQHASRGTLEKCVYDTATQIAALEAALKEAEASVPMHLDPGGRPERVAALFVREFLRLAPTSRTQPLTRRTNGAWWPRGQWGNCASAQATSSSCRMRC